MGLLDQFLTQYVDPHKRRLRGLLTDPAATLEQTAYNAVEQRLPSFADVADAQSVMPVMGAPFRQKIENIATNAGLLAMAKPTYRGQHTAPMFDSGSPAHDLTLNKTYPADVYDMGAKWYGTGEAELDSFAFNKMRQVRGNPDAKVVIWRAIPKDAPMELNPGDWVSISSTYARNHGDAIFGSRKNYKMVRREVRASDIFTNGDSILEWGYDPKP